MAKKVGRPLVYRNNLVLIYSASQKISSSFLELGVDTGCNATYLLTFTENQVISQPSTVSVLM